MLLKRIFHIITLVFFLIALPFFKAQGQFENVWAFGSKAGLDFTSGRPLSFQSQINTSEGCASVSDVTGRLLFYTDGNLCWDRNHNIMPNGIGLNPFSTRSGSQPALIVRMMDSLNKYYVFTLSSAYERTDVNPEARGRLNYNIVNMELNNGLGDVEIGRRAIPLDSGLTEHMTGIAGDRCNIWLLVVSKDDTLKAYSIDATGIAPAPVATPILIANDSSVWNGVIGCMEVSPDRSKLAIARSYLALYNFNPATGVVTNPVILSRKDSAQNYYDSYTDYYSVCFSPDNSKLYANNGFTISGAIEQFDLSSNDSLSIVNSRIVVHDNSVFYCNIKRGPDNKIYIGSNDNAVDVIDLPDLAGTACQYVVNAVPLVAGTKGSNGLPNIVPVLHKDTIEHQFYLIGCYGDAIPLHADSSGMNYSWNTGLKEPTLMVMAPGKYWVSYSLSSCSVVVDTFDVFFTRHMASVEAVTGCRWDSAGLAWISLPAGDTMLYTYSWLNSNGELIRGPVKAYNGDSLKNISLGSYSVKIHNRYGCDTTIHFTIATPDTHTSFSSDSIICAGSMLNFRNTSPDSFTSYEWNFGDGSTSTEANPVHSYREGGNYIVYLVGYPCRDSSFRAVTVDPLPSVEMAVGDSVICEGKSIWFLGTYDTTGNTGLEWNFGDGIKYDAKGDSVTGYVKLEHAYDTSGILKISLYAAYRVCPDTVLEKQMTVEPFPSLDLGEDTSACLNGAAIIIGDYKNQLNSDVQWKWNTGDTTPVISVRHPGMYTASVLINGCSGNDSVVVQKDCYLDIPNAFTPDGDGLNDYFLPRSDLSESIAAFTMQVYDRWGNLLFSTSSIDGRGWDGRFNGEKQQQGVYVYIIEVSFEGGRKEYHQGNITLIR